MALRPFRDLRFFESEDPAAEPGGPRALGRLFPLADKHLHSVGDRFARKLGELGFRTPEFTHLYVTLTPALGGGSCRRGEEPAEPWFSWVDVGAVPALWIERLRDASAQEAALVEVAARALRHLCAEERLDPAPVVAVHRALVREGSALEIVHSTKRTKSYELIVSYQIRPDGGPSQLIVRHTRLPGGETRIARQRLKSYEDVFSLAASASVTGGAVKLTPRTSFQAKLVTKSYRTPLTFPLSTMTCEQPRGSLGE